MPLLKGGIDENSQSQLFLTDWHRPSSRHPHPHPFPHNLPLSLPSSLSLPSPPPPSPLPPLPQTNNSHTTALTGLKISREFGGDHHEFVHLGASFEIRAIESDTELSLTDQKSETGKKSETDGQKDRQKDRRLDWCTDQQSDRQTRES